MGWPNVIRPKQNTANVHSNLLKVDLVTNLHKFEYNSSSIKSKSKSSKMDLSPDSSPDSSSSSSSSSRTFI